MSTVFVFTPVLLFALLLVFLLPVLVRLFRQRHLDEASAHEWLQNFSPVSYYPMEGLLADEDFHFLARQPGFESSLHRKLRKDRLRIFRQYLNRLIGDFNRLHRFTRFYIARTPQHDNSDLLGRLLWLRVRFGFTVLRVESSLLLCYVGFRPMLVKEMIQSLEEMSRHFEAIRSPA